MKKIITLSICILILLSLAGSAAGDSGAVSPDYEISEPGQNAVIGWNETHEKLILSTDFRRDDDGEEVAVRVIPFPSLPSVEKSDDEVFEEVDDILSGLLESRERTGDEGAIGADGNGDDVKVEWTTDIGSHNVTAYRVNSSQVFGELVKSKFKSEDVADWEMDEDIESVIKDYLERDLNYFVIDIVDFEGEGGKVVPLMYEFPTAELYYPLLISGLSKRVGDVKLAVFSKKMMDSEEF